MIRTNSGPSPKQIELAEVFCVAVQQHRAGNIPQAEALYRAVLAESPGHADAWHLLGTIRLQTSDFAQAAEYISQALSLNPQNAAAHSNLGNALRGLKKLDEALASYNRAIAIRPGFVDAHYNSGNALRSAQRYEDALQSYNAALAADPGFAAAHFNRGHTLQDLRRHEEALASYDRALALVPDSAEFLVSRGNALKDLGRYEEALDSYDRALALRPDDPDALTSRGNACAEINRIDEALDNYTRALAIDPDNAEARNNRGLLRLLLGRTREGWLDCESRWRLARPLSLRPLVNAPTWTGEPIARRRILIYNEQGLGDTLQFARYLPMISDLGAEVTFFCPTKLVRLLRTLPAPIRFVPTVDEHERYDFQCALMSLPMVFGTDIDTIPNRTPYLSPEAALVQRWRQRIGNEGFKVGICWHGNNVGRAIPLRSFAPLSRVPNVRLIAVQKGEGLRQLGDLPPGMTVETLGEDFDSGPDAFADTAAAMEALDLVVTADTSLAHVGGALGRPVWIALRSIPDWRWMLERSNSPWYPSVRLFRQRVLGDWDEVLGRIGQQLRMIAAPEH